MTDVILDNEEVKNYVAMKNIVTGVNSRSRLNVERYNDREMLRDFKEGEKAIKRKCEFYLPKFPTEDGEMYQNRVNNSFLYNLLAISIQRVSNKPLNKQIQIISDDEYLVSTMYNFDNNGRTLLDFTRDFLKDSLWYNQGYAFVEDDDVVIIDVDNILQTEVERGDLTYLRFKDIVCRRNGWDDEIIEVVRIFEKFNGKVYYSYYVQVEEGSDAFYEEILDQEYFIQDIPLVRFYPFGTKCEFAPELIFQPTAEMQKVLYKVDSDILNMMSIAAVPFLFFKGVDINDDENPLVISSFNAVAANTDYADVKYIEATCSSLNVLRQERDGIVEKVKSLTVDIMNKASENVTATASNIDEGNNNAMMSCVAVGLQEFLAKIISMKYKFKRAAVEPVFTIQLTTNFSINTKPEELTFLTALFASGVISKKLIFEEAQKRGIITADLTFQEDLVNVDSEMGSGGLYKEM